MLPSTSLRTDIACVYIRRFAVEVERQRRNDIATRLILIGDAAVFDCSLGAEASGVKRGMRMSQAIGLCHRAVVLAPDLPHYQRRFEEVLDFLENFSPVVEPGDPPTGSGCGLGTAFLSLDGLPVEPLALAHRLIAALHRRFGLIPSVGIAVGKSLAGIAARLARPGLARVVPPGEEAAFLAPLSVDFLSVSDGMRQRLHLLGLEAAGDIARLPLGPFQQQFGPEGKRCWELARGIHSDPLIPRVKEETVVRQLQLPAPAVSLEVILVGLERLIYAAYSSPDRKGRWVRKVVVRANLDCGGSLRQAQGGAWELSVPFREALADARDAWFAVKSAVQRHPPQRPVEELEAELVGLSGESGKQATMFDGRTKLQRQVEEAARQVRAQHGRSFIGKVVEVEPWSRIPERRAALVEYDS